MSASITIPAYAADTLGESLTVEAPEDWHDRIMALSPRCCYGPNFHRAVKDNLVDMGDLVRRGYSTLAYDRLCQAEIAAGLPDARIS